MSFAILCVIFLILRDFLSSLISIIAIHLKNVYIKHFFKCHTSLANNFCFGSKGNLINQHNAIFGDLAF